MTTPSTTEEWLQMNIPTHTEWQVWRYNGQRWTLCWRAGSEEYAKAHVTRNSNDILSVLKVTINPKAP